MTGRLIMELRSRAPALVVWILGSAFWGLWLEAPWPYLLAITGWVSAYGIFHVLATPGVDEPATSVLVSWTVALLGGLIMLLASGLPFGFEGGVGASLVLLSWIGVLCAGAESAGRTLGAGPRGLLAVGVPASVALLAPLLGSGLFPHGVGLALLVSPVVSAGRALAIEVAQQQGLYQLSALGVVPFRYPPYTLHVALAVIMTVGFLGRASLRSGARWR